jgi:hypothetical protein
VFAAGAEFFDGMPYDKILAQIARRHAADVVMMGSDIASAWSRGQRPARADDPLRGTRSTRPGFYRRLPRWRAPRAPGPAQLTATDRAYLFMNRDVVAAVAWTRTRVRKAGMSW